MIRHFSTILIGLLLILSAHANEPLSEADEARAVEIGKTLRCVVCQNQSIEDSNAPIAGDMRRVVRDRVRAGDNDGEVRDYLRARYGDFVLMRPPFQMNTFILWGTPFLLVLMAVGYFIIRSRETTMPDTEQPLSAADRKRIDDLLSEDGDASK